MRVRLGWSGETQTNVWQKADVELDETDLQRLLVDIDVKPHTSVAFKLLSNEAELLLLNKLKEYGYPEGQAASRQNTLSGQNEAILGMLKKTSA